jgi:F0F1-type ATP synthase assembly protein I
MKDEKPRNFSHKRDELNLSSFAGFGLQFAIAIVLFLLLGQWADKKLGTAPVLLMIGVFIGGAGAFYNLYRRITQAQKADDERRRNERNGNER